MENNNIYDKTMLYSLHDYHNIVELILWYHWKLKLGEKESSRRNGKWEWKETGDDDEFPRFFAKSREMKERADYVLLYLLLRLIANE